MSITNITKYSKKYLAFKSPKTCLSTVLIHIKKKFVQYGMISAMQFAIFGNIGSISNYFQHILRHQCECSQLISKFIEVFLLHDDPSRVSQQCDGSFHVLICSENW